MVALLRHQPTTARPRPAPLGHRSAPAPLRLVVGGRPDRLGPQGREARWGARGQIRQEQDSSTDGSPGTGGAPVGRPELELVPGVEGVVWPSGVVIAVVALVVFGLFGLVRVAQGSPGAAAEVAEAEASAPVAGPGDRVVVAGQGDSLWSIAVSMSPDGAPRPVVAALIEANGGETVRIGQQIVIPARLLD